MRGGWVGMLVLSVMAHQLPLLPRGQFPTAVECDGSSFVVLRCEHTNKAGHTAVFTKK